MPMRTDAWVLAVSYEMLWLNMEAIWKLHSGPKRMGAPGPGGVLLF